MTGTSDGLGRLIDELEAFFRVVAENGGQRASFDYALLNDGDEDLIELTYRPTGVVRRYDAKVLPGQSTRPPIIVAAGLKAEVPANATNGHRGGPACTSGSNTASGQLMRT